MEIDEQKKQIENRMSLIKNKIIIISNKGGVGKSTLTAILASYLNLQGYKVGLLDIDIHGPSQAKLFGLEDEKIFSDNNQNLIPLTVNSTFKLLTTAGLIDKEKATIWRGPFKTNLIMQFLTYTQWGNLDYLLIDSPPGTGDEPLTILQNIPDIKALIISTAQELALIDTKKAISFLKEMKINILGVVENMSTAICPHCEKELDLFKNTSKQLNIGVNNIYKIPFIQALLVAAEKGVIFDAVEKNTQINKYIENIKLF